MEKTKKKLDEAKYFLDQLTHNEVNFDFIFSAFISSARSVLWVMHHEFSGDEAWETWYDLINPSRSESDILKQANALRVQTTKNNPIETDYHLLPGVVIKKESYPVLHKFWDMVEDGDKISIEFIEGDNGSPVQMNVIILEDDGGLINLDDNPFLVEPEEVLCMKAKIKNLSDELDPRQKLIILAKKYYSFLGDIVERCATKFIQQGEPR